MGEIKLQLEDAAFKYAHPEEYKWIFKETKEKISKALHQKWLDGVFDNRAPTLKSKGQKELCNILRKFDNDMVEEYGVSNKPFDAYIPNKKLLFEFNGTYWPILS